MRTATGNLGEGGGRNLQRLDSNPETDCSKFRGTENPRHLRVLNGLLRRPMSREHIDTEGGCSNGPDLISNLRSRGLSIPCDRTPILDRDGREVMRGIYRLTWTDRRKLHEWLATRRR
jgi:hypothetical protein